MHTAYFSTTAAGARKRRIVVFAMLFAFLAWVLTCSNMPGEIGHFKSAAGHRADTTANSLLGTSHDTDCCIAAPQAVVLATAQKLSPTLHFMLTAALPIMVAWLAALLLTLPGRDFMRSSASGRTKNSLLLWARWAQAPPR